MLFKEELLAGKLVWAMQQPKQSIFLPSLVDSEAIERTF